MKLWKSKSRSILLAGLIAGMTFAPLTALADEWRPNGTVRVIAPYSAGGITDIIARLVAGYMQEKWGSPVIVENKTGAGGTIGTAEVANSAPDGLTLLLGSTAPQTVAYSLFNNMPYKPEDLTSISLLVTGSNVLMANNDVPANSLSEFIAWARANPDKVTYASAGIGSMTHLTGLWFFNLLGINATHVPYRGSAPAVTDLLGGVVSVFFDNLSNGNKFILDGQVKGLGVTSRDKNQYTDMAPIVGQTPELKDFVVDTFYGVFGPAGMPEEVVTEINTTIKEWLDDDATKARMTDWAATAAWAPHAETETYIANEIAKWRTLIDAEGIKLDLQ